MANPQTPYIKDSEQIVLNKSFDPDFNVLVTEALQYNGSALTRMPTPPVDSHFDYIGITNSATDQDTLVFKRGGSGGTTVKTLVIGYATGAEKVSDSLASLSFS